MSTIKVKNVARRTLFLDGGKPLEHGKTTTVDDGDHTQALIADGALLEIKPKSKAGNRSGGEDK